MSKQWTPHSIEENNKFWGGIGSRIKNGGNMIKEKFSNIFTRKKVIKTTPFERQINNNSNNKTSNSNNSLNPENSTNDTQKKSFNIQLSEEEKGDIYEINDEDEDEDEEDEEEENEENNENNEEQGKKGDKPASKSEDTSKWNEDNIKQDNNNENNSITKDPKPNSDIKTYPINSICHFLYPKGSYISMNEINMFSFDKIKPNKQTLLSHFTFKKSDQQSQIKRPYLLFFDESFIYYLKDLKIPNELDDSLRKVGNKYNWLNWNNASFDKIENSDLWLIKWEFQFEGNLIKTQQMIFEKPNADLFYDTWNVYFENLGLKMGD